jgi:hypothetical protein
MAGSDLLIQAPDGILLHGSAAEKIVNHYSFFTVFQTPQEYRLFAESGKVLGLSPSSILLKRGRSSSLRVAGGAYSRPTPHTNSFMWSRRLAALSRDLPGRAAPSMTVCVRDESRVFCRTGSALP